jgi:hypothetical protein
VPPIQTWFVRAVNVLAFILLFGMEHFAVSCFSPWFHHLLWYHSFFFKHFLDNVSLYLETCSVAQGCDTTKLLQCSFYYNNVYICLCQSTYYWSGASQTCMPQFTNNVACTNSTQCRNDLGLYCDIGNTNNCICNSSHYFSVSCGKHQVSLD